MTEFPFGITLFGGDVAFRVDSVSPDRHHFCDVAEPPDPRSARNQLDFVFRPFNRRDTYVLKLFISPGLEGKAINYPRLSSALPIRFLDSEVRANLALTMGMWEAKKAGVRHAPRGSFAGVDLERDGLPSHYPRGVYQVAFRKKLYSSLAELQALSLRPSVDLSIQETYLRLRQTP